MKSIGATLKNDRWSWDGIMSDGSIVFIGWADLTERSPSGDILACRLSASSEDKPGAKERAAHVEQVLATNALAYLVLATPKDADAHPREIETFEDELFTVQLELREDHKVWARILGLDSAPDVTLPDIQADIAAIQALADVPDTEKAQLVQARRGQGLFRTRVATIEPRCRVTGVSDRAHLRASHIKPWKDSTNAERLDGNNGLLLAPHVDHLFDRGFISFAASGKLLVSPRLQPALLQAWNISTEHEAGTFTAAQNAYLAYHRERRFLAE